MEPKTKAKSIFEYPEASTAFKELFDRLLRESNRGAVIIGASYIEDQLTNFVISILPHNSKTYHNKLLKYPAALSSFSAKNELLYAFRFINKPLYDSINALRIIRNKAAHEPNHFSLLEFRDKLNEIFDFGQGFRQLINEQASKMLVQVKMENLIEVFDQHDFSEEQKRETISSIIEDKEMMNKWEKEVPYWELILGLTLISGNIAYLKESTVELLKERNTWSHVLSKLPK